MDKKMKSFSWQGKEKGHEEEVGLREEEGRAALGRLGRAAQDVGR